MHFDSMIKYLTTLVQQVWHLISCPYQYRMSKMQMAVIDEDGEKDYSLNESYMTITSLILIIIQVL
jgi:hypothetical protein